MRDVKAIYRPIPFWSWNGTLEEEELIRQIDRMHACGIGGFFMHARGGLKTPYLGEKWFACVDACARRARELGMEAYAYDENGWPSGFAGGKLLSDPDNHDMGLSHAMGPYDPSALASFVVGEERLYRVTAPTEGECLNIYAKNSPSTADILNGEVVDKFIALTHEEYKARDTHGIRGFFTDEPQYFRWGFPYTRVLPAYFREVYGEELLDRIGLLFVEKEGFRDLRYKYWRAMQSLMLTNFAEKIYRWCDGNGYKFTGHYIEEITLVGQMYCCAGIMPFYEFEHIPGIDWLQRIVRNENSPKQVGSVAAQLGKKQVMTETFAMCGWDATPIELKRIAEFQFVGGVNLLCHHLLPYEEHGQRKRDYPPHFSDVNPWVRKGFRTFNDYFSVLGELLANSEECVRVGVLHPIRSTYFRYDPSRGDGGEEVAELDAKWAALIEQLTHVGLPHHFIDETILARHGKTEKGQLVVGKCRYDALILPTMYTMDKSTEALLRAYVAEGGKLLLSDGAPTHLEGVPHDYGFLVSNVTLEELLAREPIRMTENDTVRIAIRKDSDGRTFIYAVNTGDAPTDVTFTVPAVSFARYDVLKDTYETVGTAVHFDGGESHLLYLSDEIPTAPAALSPLALGDTFTLCKPVDNFITLDYVAFSTDGEVYSEPLHHMGVFNEMLARRYAGMLYLKYTVRVEALPSRCLLLAERTAGEVLVNGKPIPVKGVSPVERNLLLYDIATALQTGQNEIVMAVNYFQSEHVYDVLFGNGTESLKNCLAYDTDIEAVYLMGDFGVFGDFTPGKKQGVIHGKNFYLGPQKTEIRSLIRDGFPFFAGELPLRQTVTVTDTKKALVLDRFHLVDVSVNGTEAGRMMLSHTLDLSPYLTVGENALALTVSVGNRNLLGPHHTPEEEGIAVGPGTWERLGTWKDGKSPRVVDDYAFVSSFL